MTRVMTRDEFYEELAKLDKKWFIRNGTCIRTDECTCPIIALAKAKLGREFEDNRFVVAGSLLGLLAEDIGIIAVAADRKVIGNLSVTSDQEVRPVRSSLIEARKKLLKACKIEGHNT